MDCARERIADYNLIRQGRDFELWHPEDAEAEHQLSVEWLKREFSKRPSDKTIVISHFPPAMQLRHPEFPVDELSAYFTANLGGLIEQHCPRYWLYGHNHWSDHQTIGKTQLLSNQLGYPSEQGKIPKFVNESIITLEGVQT